VLRFRSVGGKIAAAFVLVLPVLAWALGTNTYHGWKAYQNAKLVDEQNGAANNLIAGVYEILMERLATNNALLANDPAGADVLAEIQKRRSVAVQKIPAAHVALSGQDFPNKQALLGVGFPADSLRLQPLHLLDLPLRLQLLQARGFYAILSIATFAGVGITFLPVDPIKALYWSAVINGVIAVPIMAVMMLMAGRVDIMGRFTVKRRLKVLGWLAAIVMATAVVAMFVTGIERAA